jgi:hypothetical protein
MLMSCSQKKADKHSIKIADRSSEDEAKFEYLRTTLTHKNCMHEEIKSRLNSGNGSYCLVQSLLSSCLLPRNLGVTIYKTIILSFVLYGCEPWSLTLREEHRLRVFDNRVLKRKFGRKRDEVTGDWRKLHSGELNDLYSSPNIIRQVNSRRMRWAGNVAHMGEWRNAYRVAVGKPEGKIPLRRLRHRWEDGVKMDLREIGWGRWGWIGSTWLRIGIIGVLL